MPKKQVKSEKLTMSHTKKEMLEAYHSLLNQLQEKEKSALDAEKQVEQKRIEQAFQTADALSMENVVKAIGGLKAEIGRLLVQLSDRLEGEVSTYRTVQEAIKAKEKEVAEIYEIEKNAATLAALIEAQREKRESFEAEMTTQKDQLLREVEKTRSEWEEEKLRHEAEVKEKNVAEDKSRKRDEEEYNYSFERERRLARDEFEEEKKKLEAQLAEQKEKAERELA